MVARVKARVRLLVALSIVVVARMVHRPLVDRLFTLRCLRLLVPDRIATHTMMLRVLLLVQLLIIRLPFAHPLQGKKNQHNLFFIHRLLCSL